VKQAPRFDGLPFDPFSLFQNGFAPSEVDIGRGEVLQALVVAPVVVMIDKGVDLLSDTTRKPIPLRSKALLLLWLASDFRFGVETKDTKSAGEA